MPLTARIAAVHSRLKSARVAPERRAHPGPPADRLKRDATREVAAIIQHAKNEEERRRIIEGAFLAVLEEDYSSLLLERSLVEIDYQFCQQLSDEEMGKGLSRLQGKISEGLATEQLKTLCAAKCDRLRLLCLLHWLSNEPIFPIFKNWLYKPGVRTIEGLFGITPKEVKKLVTQVSDVATQIERVNRKFEFGILLLAEPLKALQALPGFLRVYAKLLQDGARHFGRRSDIYHNIAKARLTAYVKFQSGRFHDKEVAALISSVSGNEYDETDHKTWRHKHFGRLKLVDPSLFLPKR
jgi:hypothetical protein